MPPSLLIIAYLPTSNKTPTTTYFYPALNVTTSTSR